MYIAKPLEGIKQDDVEDWTEAAATMGDIYENSWITIAATGSHSSQRGIYSTVSDRYKARALENHEFQVREALPEFSDPDQHFWNHDNWPLLRRAWVYQERQLSSRMVHFGQQQILWACNSSFQSQDGWYPSKWNPSMKKSLSDWTYIVSEYSALQLSYESDRLAAIAAIVLRVMQIRPDDTYIAGMWKDTLIPDLFWYRCAPQDGAGRTHRIPTWSWASAPVSIRHFITEQPYQQVVQLLDVTFTSIGIPHIGQVEDASITLQGPACSLPRSAYAILEESDTAAYWAYTVVPMTSDVACAIFKDFDWQTVEPPVGSDHELTVLFLCEELGDSARVGQHFGGMVLKAVENDAFERVGFVYIYPDPSKYKYPSSKESRDEESSEEGGAEAAKDDEDGEDDERMDDKNTAHKGAVYFSATRPLLGAERVEINDIEDGTSGSDGDDHTVSSFVRALPVQTFRIV
ncbi:uncharacterized protein J4E92_010506 [Alternaria infectoria]|uniref:uncharacterized protein n=1 Tax=Alternaria infectoria TaxID=45303 RepID=UPI002220D530|nr:uncharacterized protein J4E92_010506 [Alternaria infectoria]KAI4909890.1 hypothetical protein J4E92_010506 [Alternaria infectoria]